MGPNLSPLMDMSRPGLRDSDFRHFLRSFSRRLRISSIDAWRSGSASASRALNGAVGVKMLTESRLPLLADSHRASHSSTVLSWLFSSPVPSAAARHDVTNAETCFQLGRSARCLETSLRNVSADILCGL